MTSSTICVAAVLWLQAGGKWIMLGTISDLTADVPSVGIRSAMCGTTSNLMVKWQQAGSL